jgi:putative DNA-invertase from lambdoid prophage Rac
MTKHAVAYVRVSTEEQTVQNQISFLGQWAQANDYKLYQFFEDPSVSGRVRTVERKGFQQLLAYLKANPCDAVLVYELSRVGRSTIDVFDAVKHIEQFCPLITCAPSQVFFQTTQGAVRNLLFGLFSALSEMERELLSERTKAGLARAREQGKVIGRPAIVFDADEVNRLFASGMTVTQVCKHLGVSKASVYGFLHKQTGLVRPKQPSVRALFMAQQATKQDLKDAVRASSKVASTFDDLS